MSKFNYFIMARIQTKELVRELMIREFGKAMPELSKLNSFPMLVTSTPISSATEVNIDDGIYWVWIISDKKFITYGLGLRNICSLSTDSAIKVFSPNIGTSCNKSGVIVRVINLRYVFDGVTLTDKVLEIDAKNNMDNLYNLIGIDVKDI